MKHLCVCMSVYIDLDMKQAEEDGRKINRLCFIWSNFLCVCALHVAVMSLPILRSLFGVIASMISPWLSLPFICDVCVTFYRDIERTAQISAHMYVCMNDINICHFRKWHWQWRLSDWLSHPSWMEYYYNKTREQWENIFFTQKTSHVRIIRLLFES